MSSDTNLEIEVKFLVTDLSTVRERLIAHGATLKKPRIYEHNIRYDDDADRLLSRGQLLRLRQDTRARITYKGIPQSAALLNSEARVREELEIDVSDFDTADAIIQRLGLVPRQVYEKYRETLQLDNVEIVLDEMPFGDFVELEGDEAEMRRLAAAVQLDWNRRILTNYLGLMAELKARYDLPFDDLTFANFEHCPVSAENLFDKS